MNSKQIKTKLNILVKKIAHDFKPEKIILFGSYVWGKPTKDSDIDLFVIQNSKLSKRTRQMAIRKLFLDFDLPADVLSYTPKELKKRIKLGDLFIKKIMSKGEILYGK
jgi:uncharacterized protein